MTAAARKPYVQAVNWWQDRSAFSDSVSGAIVWPLFRELLRSDETLATIGARVGMTARQVEAVFARPDRAKLTALSDVAYALDRRVAIRLTEAREIDAISRAERLASLRAEIGAT